MQSGRPMSHGVRSSGSVMTSHKPGNTGVDRPRYSVTGRSFGRRCRGTVQQEFGRRVCRKYRTAYIRKLQEREYDKLLNIVPSLANSRHKQRIAKVGKI